MRDSEVDFTPRALGSPQVSIPWLLPWLSCSFPRTSISYSHPCSSPGTDDSRGAPESIPREYLPRANGNAPPTWPCRTQTLRTQQWVGGLLLSRWRGGTSSACKTGALGLQWARGTQTHTWTRARCSQTVKPILLFPAQRQY